MNVAIIGAFDNENFGDLLFPDVLKSQLEKRNLDVNLLLFSPVARIKPFTDDVNVFAVRDIEKIHLEQGIDAIVLGGGDTINFVNFIANTDNYFAEYPGIDFWMFPSFVAAKYNIKLLWNCPGVPFDFPDAVVPAFTEIIDFADYLSVRDEHSKDMLCTLCDGDKITVAPDSVFSISNIISKAEAEGIYAKLAAELSLPASGEYVVVQIARTFGHDKEIAAELLKIKEKYGKKLVLMPIGYVHDDIIDLTKVKALLGDDGILIEEKLVPKTMLSVLANAFAFIGSSMHGSVVSLSYGVPSMALNFLRQPKILGFYGVINRTQFVVDDPTDISAIFDGVISHGGGEVTRYIDVCEKHFDKIAQLITAKKEQKLLPQSLVKRLRTDVESISSIPRYTVYFDTGNGFNGNEKQDFLFSKGQNFIETAIKIPAGTKGIRFDPIEEKQCVVSNLKVTSADNRHLSYILPHSCYEDGGDIYFATDDPQIVVSTGNVSEVRISCVVNFFDGQIISQLKEKSDELAEFSNTQLQKIAEYDQYIGDRNNHILALESHIWAIEHSRSWRITKPLRAVVRGIKKIKGVKLLFKGMKAVLRVGPIKAMKMTRAYLSNRKRMKKLLRDFPADFIENGSIAVDCDYQNDIDFSEYTPKVKTIAFHLPQFHTFSENDEWWGEGFTEWTNSRKGSPRFDGHYQPRTPHSDIGYYDLSDLETLKKQAEFAKRHGIYGFCFYLYWFSGKRLMEKPVDMLIEHPEIDLPFCLCWANENWTRAWDGQTSEVLIAQDYSESDPQQFIDDNKKYFDDSRYIRVNGKPVIVVYNPGHIPNIKRVFAAWRERAAEVGLGEILIWTCQTSNNTATTLKITDSVDGEVAFPPHTLNGDLMQVSEDTYKGDLHPFLYDYNKLVHVIKNEVKVGAPTPVPLYRTTMTAWDNAARRADKWTTFCGFSSKGFYEWASAIAEHANKAHTPEDNFIFVNAWNEWCEGTYLEPDEKYGYNNINTLSKAICGLPLDVRLNVFTEKAEPISSPKIAVQVHAFYTDLLDEVIENLNRIPVPFDVYVSTDSAEKVNEIVQLFDKTCNAEKVSVDFFGNMGRDVAPFLRQLEPVLSEYDYVCHIHTKKTKTGDGYGDYWRKYLYRHLFGSSDNISAIINRFEENPKVGLLFPETYPGVKPQATWGGNLLGVKALLKRIGCEGELSSEAVFPVGDMFWARTAAIKPMFDAHITDFPKEMGQVNATIMHEIERSWVYVARSIGYESEKIFNNTAFPLEYKEQNNILLYVHFDKDGNISADDISSLVKMRAVSQKIIFISNSAISIAEQDKLDGIVDGVILRPNEGYDFGAWKEIIINEIESLKEYDNVILMNNSVYGPFQNIKSVFAKMQGEDVDFWGMTIFPEVGINDFIKDGIDRHLQSYLFSLSKEVINSDVFLDFWKNLSTSNNLVETVANGETKFTNALAKKGFTYKAYVEDSELLCTLLTSLALVYEMPYQMLVAGLPFVKKKYPDYVFEGEDVKVKDFINQVE